MNLDGSCFDKEGLYNQVCHNTQNTEEYTMGVPQITLSDGNRMPQLGLGVWQAEDGEETYQAVKTAIEKGYRLIDTAMVYQNEESVGRAIADVDVPREELFITTKLWNSDQGSEKVRPAFEASLARLGLDYVDLYLIHWPMPAKNLYVDTWLELIKLKDAGLVKSIGVCNFHVEHLEELAKHTDILPAINQIELHPRLPQTEIREYCYDHGIQVESWSPIGGSRGNLLQDETIVGIAKNFGKSPAQIIIRWHIQNGLVVIPKSVRAERIEQNIDVFDFELSADDMKTLNSLENGERQGPNPETMNIN